LICPHCLTAYNVASVAAQLGNDKDGTWQAVWELCPECQHIVIRLQVIQHGRGVVPHSLVYPKGTSRRPPATEVPSPFRDDYKEACLVIDDSAKASAALSRRCLQAILRVHAKTKSKDLADQIDEVLTGNLLPSHLARAIDAVRQLGNIAAHSTKSVSTGEIVDVEPEEAEWLLETLEGLFDFYFVQPAELQKKRDALDAKLAAAKKPPLK
jgi:Domain of unknown function (DUF4145)